MTTQVPTRFDDAELAQLDALVASGAAASRSDAIRHAVAAYAAAERRRVVGQSIVDAYRALPQTADDDEHAQANANAMTEAEPW